MIVIMTVLARVVAVCTVVMVMAVLDGRGRAMRMSRRVRSPCGNRRVVIRGAFAFALLVRVLVVLGVGVVLSRVVVSSAAHNRRRPCPWQSCRQRINTFVDAKVWQ
jgi:hypothetical protein